MSTLPDWKPALKKVTDQPFWLRLPMKRQPMTLAGYIAGGLTTDKAEALTIAFEEDTSLHPLITLSHINHRLHVFSDRSVLIERGNRFINLPLLLPARILNKTLPWKPQSLGWDHGDTTVTLEDVKSDLFAAADYWQHYAAPLPKQWDITAAPIEKALESGSIYPWTHVPLADEATSALVETCQMAGTYISQYTPITHGIYARGYLMEFDGLTTTRASDWQEEVAQTLWRSLCPPHFQIIRRPTLQKGRVKGDGHRLYCAPFHLKSKLSAHDKFLLLEKVNKMTLPKPDSL